MQRDMVWSSLLALLLATDAVRADANRVTLPDYRSGFAHYVENLERADPEQISEIWANRTALESAAGGAPLAYGSVLVMEVWKAKMTEGGEEPERDAAGRPVKDRLLFVAVMEKQPGWGGIYPEEERSGEWEFAAYTPDGEFKEMDYGAKCSYCHAPLGEQDYVQSWEALLAAAE